MILRDAREAKQLFARPAERAALAAAMLMPLKLSLTYIALTPALLAWAWHNRASLAAKIAASKIIPGFYLFLLCTLLSAFFGVQPLHSLRETPTLIAFSLVILAFRDLSARISPQRVLAVLLAAQALAAFHSIIDTGSNVPLRQLFIGAVSESGQIALTLVVGVGLYAYRRAEAPALSDIPWPAFVNFVLFALIAFAPSFHLDGAPFFVLALLAAWPAAAAIGALLRFGWSGQAAPRLTRLLGTLILPLIAAALLAHLKRGPWCGVAVGVFVFALLYRKRLILPVLVTAVVLFFTVTPLRTRLEDSSRDFYISGGRSIMWRIGTEMAGRYPLGIGYANSKYLRDFAPEIPPDHKHFHNNFLNVLVETGWLSFAVFLWWLSIVLRTALRTPYAGRERLLTSAIGCAVISMLTAGLVEYNFGDSEVVLIFFVLLGVLADLSNRSESAVSVTASTAP